MYKVVFVCRDRLLKVKDAKFKTTFKYDEFYDMAKR